MDASPLTVALGFALMAALAVILLIPCAIVRHKIARPAVAAPHVSAGRSIEAHCCTRGHFYRKAFADMWRCVNCGHLQPVSQDDVLDAATEDFRGELGHIEAFANGEVSA